MTFGSRLQNIIISQSEYYLYEGRIDKNISKNTLIRFPLYKIEDDQYLFTTLKTKDCDYVCDYPLRVSKDSDGLFLEINCNYKKKKRFNIETPYWLDDVHLKYIVVRN